MARVLLTSFEPFGGQAVNASLEVGRAVAAHTPAGVVLDWLVLPVVAGACVDAAWAHVEAARPELVLALGQCGNRSSLRVECRAINRHDFPFPDNAGYWPRGEPIDPDGPPEYPTTIPAGRVVRALARSGVPAALSESAGEYVCNHLLYGLLHRAARDGRTHQTGFIHVPLLPAQRDTERGEALPLEVMAEGVRVTIAECVRLRTHGAQPVGLEE